MDDRRYQLLKYTAIVMAIAWVGWSLYDYLGRGKQPGDYAYHAASNYFADGHYEKALAEYEAALREDPDHIPAKRGKAETLIMLKQERQAINLYDELIARQPDEPSYYANLGIAYDRLGEHKKALANYEMALNIDSETGAGPDWLTRFLRNQPDKPPGIADRARYLKTQLALPKAERLLKVPEVDEAQRPYKE